MIKHTAKILKRGGYQWGLSSMVYKLFEKKHLVVV